MAAGAPDDVLRSLRRYVWLMLGPSSSGRPWPVRLQRTRVEDDERPVAVIDEPAGLATAHSRAGTFAQGDQQKQQSYAIVCYPELRQTAASSAHEARRVRSLLDAGFSRGLVTSDDPPASIGAPWRVPVYDFADVPIEGPERQGPDAPYMHANVDETFNVRAIQDPLDELRFTVVANLRVSWWAAGRIGPAAPIAVDVPATPVVR